MHVNAFGIMAMAFLGLMGGLIGAYFSTKNTNGPRERAFMLKVSIVAMVAVSVFVGLLYVLPNGVIIIETDWINNAATYYFSRTQAGS